MSRRTFLRGFGLVGVVVAGASSALDNNEPVKIPVPAPEIPKINFAHLAPENQVSSLMIVADNRTLEERNTGYSNGPYSLNSAQVTNQVSISVGKDNRLWLKIDDEWKRVALDA
jgi:hypothetical protein